VVTAALPIDAGDTALRDTRAATLRGIVDDVHRRGALIVARFALPATAPEGVAVAAERAAAAGFDALLLDPYAQGETPETPETPDATDAPGRVERLAAAVAAARTTWRPGGWIAAAVRDQPAARAALIGHAAQVVRAGADLLWVSAPADAHGHGARLPAAPLADRLRNQLGVATAIECGDVLQADLDAAIAAGRADLVAIAAASDGDRRPA